MKLPAPKIAKRIKRHMERDLGIETILSDGRILQNLQDKLILQSNINHKHS